MAAEEAAPAEPTGLAELAAIDEPTAPAGEAPVLLTAPGSAGSVGVVLVPPTAVLPEKPPSAGSVAKALQSLPQTPGSTPSTKGAVVPIFEQELVLGGPFVKLSPPPPLDGPLAEFSFGKLTTCIDWLCGSVKLLEGGLAQLVQQSVSNVTSNQEECLRRLELLENAEVKHQVEIQQAKEEIETRPAPPDPILQIEVSALRDTLDELRSQMTVKEEKEEAKPHALAGLKDVLAGMGFDLYGEQALPGYELEYLSKVLVSLRSDMSTCAKFRDLETQRAAFEDKMVNMEAGLSKGMQANTEKGLAEQAKLQTELDSVTDMVKKLSEKVHADGDLAARVRDLSFHMERMSQRQQVQEEVINHMDDGHDRGGIAEKNSLTLEKLAEVNVMEELRRLRSIVECIEQAMPKGFRDSMDFFRERSDPYGGGARRMTTGQLGRPLLGSMPDDELEDATGGDAGTDDGAATGILATGGSGGTGDSGPHGAINVSATDGVSATGVAGSAGGPGSNGGSVDEVTSSRGPSPEVSVSRLAVPEETPEVSARRASTFAERASTLAEQLQDHQASQQREHRNMLKVLKHHERFIESLELKVEDMWTRLPKVVALLEPLQMKLDALSSTVSATPATLVTVPSAEGKQDAGRAAGEDEGRRPNSRASGSKTPKSAGRDETKRGSGEESAVARTPPRRQKSEVEGRASSQSRRRRSSHGQGASDVHVFTGIVRSALQKTVEELRAGFRENLDTLQEEMRLALNTKASKAELAALASRVEAWMQQSPLGRPRRPRGHALERSPSPPGSDTDILGEARAGRSGRAILQTFLGNTTHAMGPNVAERKKGHTCHEKCKEPTCPKFMAMSQSLSRLPALKAGPGAGGNL